MSAPWVWLSSNNLTSRITGKKLTNSVFEIGGGYLSGDLMRFLRTLGGEAFDGPAGVEIAREYLGEGEFYAPGGADFDGDMIKTIANRL